MKNIILTGDRPTGKLHIGHYVGSLKERVIIQNEEDYEKLFIMIADSQALTDNFNDPKKVRENVIELALDYLACGIDPNKTTIFIQSEVKALPEMTTYFLNLVNLSRLMRNPTVKEEIKQRGFDQNIPMGFLIYPVSQAADITAFKANLVPVGDDQEPMLEQTREIVRSFNRIYGDTLIEPKSILPKIKSARRLKGIDGKQKMSKSLGNCIYLSDSEEDLYKKVMMMYTDPLHIKVEMPGHIENNTVFEYLDIFSKEEDFNKHLSDYKNLDELKKAYQKGGVGDVLIKKFLFNVLNDTLKPFREKREELAKDKDKIMKILEKGSIEANLYANETLKEMKQKMRLDYFK